MEEFEIVVPVRLRYVIRFLSTSELKKLEARGRFSIEIRRKLDAK